MQLARRQFIGLLGSAAATWPLGVRAEREKQPARIGFLRQAGPHAPQLEAFRSGMRALGYVEGHNIVIEQRYAAGVYTRLDGLATELVNASMQVIVVDGPAAAQACKNATSTIPVVFTLTVDPVAEGLIASFGHPGGNLTGLTMAAGYGLAGKQVELLKQIAGGLSRLAVLSDPENPPRVQYLKETQRVATALGIEMQEFMVKAPGDLPGAFAAMAAWRANGLVTLADGLLFSQRDQLVGLAMKYRLPGVHPEAEFVEEAGGLASYGPNLSDLFRRAAWYVAKTLEGAKPAEIPIEQPTKFDMVVSLKAASRLGLTLPLTLLATADKIVG